jgi:uncharacterized protein
MNQGLKDLPLRFSRFCHLIKKGSYAALFHSLNLEVVFLSLQTLKLISEFRNGKTINSIVRNSSFSSEELVSFTSLVKKLMDFKMLVSLQHKETAELERIQKKYLRGTTITMAYLILTDDCNLRCRYCFVEGGLPVDYQFSYMSPETARKSLDLFAKWSSRNKSNRKTIIFYGGEPLLNKKTFCTALKHISQLKNEGLLPEELEISIITNGTLIDREIAQLIKEYDLLVGISMDGGPEAHDKYRCYADGKGSFQDALRGYKILKEEEVDISVSFTVTPFNVRNLISHVKWIVENLKLRGLGLNLLMDNPEKTIATEEYAKKAGKEMIRCFKYLRRNGIYEDRMMRKVENFVKKQIYPVDCGACGRQIVFLPSGQVGMCQAYIGTKKFFRDPVKGFSPYTDKDFKIWANRSPLTMAQCQNCIALGLCGGGCPARADFRHGDIFSLDNIFCIHAKETIKWMIDDLYKQQGDR